MCGQKDGRTDKSKSPLKTRGAIKMFSVREVYPVRAVVNVLSIEYQYISFLTNKS